MEIIDQLTLMQKKAETIKREGQRIGFVPTMGYLHEGHFSLIKAARQECAVVVVSIFVNPLQFGPAEDFKAYPRDLARDSQLTEQAGTDILFLPQAEEMYPPGFQTTINVEKSSEHLCGRFRPGHFQGVATVVCKLFHLVKPDLAYFGQKDFQQLTIIKRMVDDLNLDIEIKGLPTVREDDGLAKSSRNAYLNQEERKASRCLYQALLKAQRMKQEGIIQASLLIKATKEIISREQLVKPEYIIICHPQTLEDLEMVEDQALMALAVRIGRTRLIDNLLL